MKKQIFPGSLRGTIIAPSSKSYSQRAILAASLAHGVSCIKNVGYNKDTDAIITALSKLGVVFDGDGVNLEVKGGLSVNSSSTISVGESGLATRLMIPVLSLFDKECVITGEGTILNRKMDDIQSVLDQLCVDSSFVDGFLPVKLKGPIQPGPITIDCSKSSQYLSGLLFALPLSTSSSRINVLNLVSRPYIQITLDVLRNFGIEVSQDVNGDFIVPGNQKFTPSDYTIEGDWSGVSTLLVAPGRKTIRGLNMKSSQADKEIIKAMTSAGLNVISTGNDVTVFGSEVRPFVFDATDCPDLFPALAVLATRASAGGVTVLIGSSRLVNKESNRLLTIRDQFQRLGVFIDIKEDNKMLIPGGQHVHSSEVSSCCDHRIAMALASLSLMADDGPTTINESEAVNKSYKNFWNDFNTLFTYE